MVAGNTDPVSHLMGACPLALWEGVPFFWALVRRSLEVFLWRFSWGLHGVSGMYWCYISIGIMQHTSVPP